MRILTVAALIAGVGCLAACNPPPAAPSPASPSPSTSLMPPGTHQSPITSMMGMGQGGVSVTPKAIPEGTMAVDISVIVADTSPNTTFFLQRAPDVGRTLQSDGICQRALSIAPWSPADPPAPAFLTFPL